MRMTQPPQIDMHKVMLAAERIMEKERAELQAKRDKIIIFERATADIKPPEKPLPQFSIPEDAARRNYQRQIRKGCSGFSHPHFHNS